MGCVMRKGLLSPELSPDLSLPSLQIFQQIKSRSTALMLLSVYVHRSQTDTLDLQSHPNQGQG